MLFEIRDDVIWFKHLKHNPLLFERVARLDEGESVTLSVDGTHGRWVRMRRGRDGRPTYGIKPVGEMAKVWASLQSRRGKKVRLELPDYSDDEFLKLASETFTEWLSPEDEEAFAHLQET